jgi:23S rRNA (guanosine2251-2'-O)-methyltransferase
MPVGDRKLEMDELGRIGPEEYRAMPKAPVRLVLDDIRSRHNVGSIFRTADAFGVEGIDLCGFTPLPPHREIEKTALGATLSVPWRHVPDALAAVQDLRRDGYRIWAVEQTVKAVRLGTWQPLEGEHIALVLGNEVNGVGPAVVEAVDGCLEIPQRGTKHSLNVSVCAGIVLAHALRMLR